MIREKQIKLSAVIPAYNEERRLPKTLSSVIDYFNNNNILSEIIIVDDGSTDKTIDIVESFLKNYKNISLIKLPQNRGKGFAVKTGVMSANYPYVIFFDADGSTPISEIDKLLEHIENNDIVIGSRYADKNTVKRMQTFPRRVVGKIANFLTSKLLFSDIKDVRCGFKIFRNDVAKRIFNEQTISGWGFDPEILALAKISGMTIIEVPVAWSDEGNSKVRLLQDSFKGFFEIFRVWWRIKIWKKTNQKFQ